MDTMIFSLAISNAYLDDIRMNSKSVVEDEDHIHKAFPKIQEFGFKIKETKCDFFRKKIKYLGHIID